MKITIENLQEEVNFPPARSECAGRQMAQKDIDEYFCENQREKNFPQMAQEDADEYFLRKSAGENFDITRTFF